MIYFDNNASTPLAPQVRDTLIESLDLFGNPSSVHQQGREAKNAYLKAKRTIAQILGVAPHTLSFSSGATESINHLAYHCRQHKLKPLYCHVEHPATTASLQHVPGSIGFSLDSPRPITPQDIEPYLQHNHANAVFMMAVNHETGIMNEWEDIAKLCNAYRVPCYVDAVAMFGKAPLVIPHEVDAMVFSSHKIHGPKGIGLLYAKTPLTPWIVGGPQESQQRAGTENLPNILGFATACTLMDPQHVKTLHALRDAFETQLCKTVSQAQPITSSRRIGNVSSICFSHLDAESLLMGLDLQNIQASHGSACTSGAMEPSKVLLHYGLSMSIARSCLRFSFSRYNRFEEIDQAVAILTQLCQGAHLRI